MQEDPRLATLHEPDLSIKGQATAMCLWPKEDSILLFYNRAAQITKSPFNLSLNFKTPFAKPSAAVVYENNIYITAKNGLFMLNTKTFEFNQFDQEDWSYSIGLFAYKDFLFAVGYGIYKINPKTGSYTTFYKSEGWNDANVALQVDRYLYIPMLSSGCIYKVDLETPDAETEWLEDWYEVTAGVVIKENLYFFSKSIWKVNLCDGYFTEALPSKWSKPGVCVAIGKRIYMYNESGFWEINLVSLEVKKIKIGQELEEKKDQAPQVQNQKPEKEQNIGVIQLNDEQKEQENAGVIKVLHQFREASYDPWMSRPLF